MKVWWAVMRMMTWDSLEVRSAHPLLPNAGVSGMGDGGPVAFMPIFDTLEAAVAWSDNGKYLVQPIRERDGEA